MFVLLALCTAVLKYDAARWVVVDEREYAYRQTDTHIYLYTYTCIDG